MPAPSRDQFFSGLFNARNRVRFAMDDAFRPLGITDATWRTLFYLEQTGSGCSQKQLAETMGIEGPSLVRLLDNLEARDLIERRQSDTDRRAKSVHLTRASKKLLVQLRDIAAQVRGSVLKHISDEDIAACLRVFNQILSATNTEGPHE